MVKYGLIPDDEHHHPNSSSNSSGSSTPRHFFIPIFSTPSSTTTLQPFCIPKAFMKYLQVGKKKIKKKSHEKRRELLEAILRSNGRGKSFHVNMIMDKDGRLMSDDEHEHHQQVEEDEDEYAQQARGWKNFSDYHDLQVGDFLLFRHLGSLSFDVIVFDSTTCQRKYPPSDPPFFFFDHATTGKNFKTTTPDRAKRADADSSNDDDTPSNQFITSLKHYNFSQWMMTIPRGFTRSNGLGNKTCTITFRDEKGRSWPIDLRHKKTRDQAYVRGGWREFIEGNGLKEGDICTFELVSRRGGTKNIVFDVYRGSKTTTSDHAKRADADGAAAAAAAAAESSNESTPSKVFTTRLKYYNFSHSTMTIPAKFVRSNGLDNQTCMIIFRDEKGRSWPIKLGNKGGNQVYVRGGWPQFIKGNGLKEGDVCTFELVSRRGGTKNIVFDVRRDSKTTTPDQVKRADAGADSAASGSSNDDDTPSNQFTTPLKHYSFTQWTMNFPAKFVRFNGLGNINCTITFRNEKGRSWPMDLRYKESDGQVYIRGGWRQFIEGNGLKEGDICTFELVSRRGGTKNIVFDVHRVSKTTTPVQAKRADADGAAAAGSSNLDDTPSSQFTTTLKHYNFSQWTMSVPTEFTRSNGLGNKTCTITFIDEKGRSWPIDLRYKKSRDQVYVRGGWREFIEGNGLKEGDVCTFELVSRRGGTKNIVFDVYRGTKDTVRNQAKRADDAATTGSSNDDTPSNQFTTPLKYYNFSQNTVTFPMEFVRYNGLGNKTCTITFRDEKGRSWPIGLRYKKSSGQVYVHSGWRQFIKGNGLKEGNVCTFELVSRRGGTKNIIFDVRRGHH